MGNEYVLIYPGSYRDPRIRRLSDAAAANWYVIVTLTATHGQTVPFDAAIDALSKFVDYNAESTGDQLRELEAAELVHLHADGGIELLARGDLWALPEDVPEED